jgi:hypothetical protein
MSEDHGRHVLARRARDSELARAVPLLQPEALHALIIHRGLHDCGELLALVTPEQLSAVFDLDLWTARDAGGEEHFDAARFCEWLEVLVDAGPALAAARLAALDVALVVAGLSPHVIVFDAAVFSPAGEPTGADVVLNAGRERGVHAEIGGYLVIARQTDAWEAIVEVLAALDEHHSDVFQRVMQDCRTLSNSGWELDGLDDLLSAPEQARFDLSVSREQRRERLGYVAPHDARAFLAAARQVPRMTPRRSDPVSPAASGGALLVQEARSADDPELFLANVLMSGCSVQGRSFTRREAIDAVAATCKLGLERSPSLSPDQEGVVMAFQVGWSVLHRDVSIFVATQLLDTLDHLRPDDRDLQLGLYALKRELHKQLRAGMPWLARGRLDVLTSFDLPSWAALAALLDQCPVMLANVRRRGDPRLHAVDPLRFQFIAGAADVAAVHQFLRSVSDLLTQ